jgi:hypothetical protein
MRIAMISPLEMRVPPLAYGGTELVVSLLTEELVRRGHDVTLFASGDSVTRDCLNMLTSRQTAHHEATHDGVNEGLAGLAQPLVVLA